MLRCWRCNSQFAKKIVLRDSILRTRDEGRGGPYQVYKCSMCNRECRIERTPKGRLFASPEKEISTFDYLFGWLEPLAPDDFLKIVEWHQLHAERRASFFLQDGDDRYSKRRLKGFLNRVFGRTEPTREEKSTHQGSESRTKLNLDRSGDPLPHPYRILGVTREATDDEIREAFRNLARTWHPDKLETRDAESIDNASRRLQQLVDAYEALKREREA